nr:MAG TPA: hypothetical protein [Caudoviricetes sp.]DAV93022.1 MAG TPA: hypothetical protein [Bacteriophage sp.]
MRNSHHLYTDYPHISVLIQCLSHDTYHINLFKNLNCNAKLININS